MFKRSGQRIALGRKKRKRNQRKSFMDRSQRPGQHSSAETEETQGEKQPAVAYSQMAFGRVMRPWCGSQAAGYSKSVEGGK